ncbi:MULTISPECIES: helix-turn-helix domain-containing protein [unclassified Brevundimonas]|uniref:helix-turn-helix domain-containing protein n=1 Tax=unclassified Brevundimonas TaxID=2622653 RepID=UPI0025C10FA1|nr:MULTISPECIES: helix-turn-helix domain-containing protein [unclassified Brevundimonas]
MSGAGVFRQYAVPEPLAPYVRRIWSYVDECPSAIERIVPDGFPELVIDLAGRALEIRTDGTASAQPPVLMAGQLTRPMTLKVEGPVHVVGVSFHPDGARDFWGQAMQGLTDRRLDASHRLPEALASIKDETALVCALIGELSEKASGWSIDPLVREQIEGRAPVATDPASVRNLQRRFLDRVGVSARSLRSVQRFRAVFDHADQDENWLQAGLAAGYFDQPHLARDFQRFVGCSATAWARERLALTRAILS